MRKSDRNRLGLVAATVSLSLLGGIVFMLQARGNALTTESGIAPEEPDVYRPYLLDKGSSRGAEWINDSAVSLLRSSNETSIASFYKHSVPTGLREDRANSESIPSGRNESVSAGQGPELDYSTFKHTSQRHASLACTSCHQRSNNSATPSFPGHPACINCHGNQFFTSSSPMCLICHVDVNTAKAPLKSFPASFKERFNVNFDHAQHMNPAVRPKNGCAACHTTGVNRGVALSIPAALNAHNQCYVCHTPASKSAGGKDLGSCGVCHEQKNYQRTATNSAAFRASFSHAKHGPRQRLTV